MTSPHFKLSSKMFYRMAAFIQENAPTDPESNDHLLKLKATRLKLVYILRPSYYTVQECMYPSNTIHKFCVKHHIIIINANTHK